ncbi:unnamed protein product [Owenia fusiformis]|uniref:Uncharacterized protein n=1 Tax=Owenia fusiformis TaxID=6347 RepID=A0A8J1XUN1_OWEFU|nr:unnamed protein product [Owenia fusiformis]
MGKVYIAIGILVLFLHMDVAIKSETGEKTVKEGDSTTVVPGINNSNVTTANTTTGKQVGYTTKTENTTWISDSDADITSTTVKEQSSVTESTITNVTDTTIESMTEITVASVTDSTQQKVTQMTQKMVTSVQYTIQSSVTNMTKIGVTDTALTSVTNATRSSDHTSATININANISKPIYHKCPRRVPTGWRIEPLKKLEKLLTAQPECKVDMKNLNWTRCDRNNVTISMVKTEDLLAILDEMNKTENCPIDICDWNIIKITFPFPTNVILPIAQMNSLLMGAENCGVNTSFFKWLSRFDECTNTTKAILSSVEFERIIDIGGKKCVKKQCKAPNNPYSRLKNDVTKVLVVMEVYVFSIICFMGIVGNILSFLTLSSTDKVNTSVFILKTLAITDGIHLLLRILTQPYNAAYYYTDWIEKSDNKLKETLADTYMKVVGYAIPLVEMAQMASAWLVVFLTLDRFIAICFPFKALSFCSMKKARLGISIVITGAVLYNIPLYFGYDYQVQRNECTKLYFINIILNTLGKNIVYRGLYTLGLNLVFRNVLPVGLVLGMNIRLVHELRLSRQRRPQMMSITDKDIDKKEKNITVTLISISFVFLICVIPMVALSIWQIINFSIIKNKLGNNATLTGSKYNATLTGLMLYWMVVDLLLIINSAINILVYCLVRTHFMSDMCRMLRCKYRNLYATRATQLTGSATRSGSRGSGSGSGKPGSEHKNMTAL